MSDYDHIQQKHIASKKRIGTTKEGQPIAEILLKGGLILISTIKDGKPMVVGSGPHQAVARYLAKKNLSGAEFLDDSDLHKSVDVTLEGILSVAPQYQAIVDQINAALNRS